MAKVAISIVLYQNDRALLARAIRSAMAIADGQDQFRVVVVDNSPTQELQTLAKIDPRITYDYVGSNIGFGAAHNRAVKAIGMWSDAHLYLNPDVEFGPEVLPTLMRYLEEHTDVGLCMPRIVYKDGARQPACKLLPTPTQLILRRLPLVKQLSRKGNVLYEMAAADFDREMNVPFLSGCFLFVRTATLREVGGFDERYFMYQEDTDLCRRFHERSKTMYVPSVTVMHEAQYGSRKNRKLALIHIQSAIRYFNKWGWVFDSRRKAINRKAVEAYLLHHDGKRI